MTNAAPKSPITDASRVELEARARVASQGSYAPYSNFHVGAAVLGKSGRIFTGANVENASYGLAICAERVALANARISGESDIVGIAIACVDAKVDSPLGGRMQCGACRQWIQELAPSAAIFVDGTTRTFTINDLLPDAFSLGPT